MNKRKPGGGVKKRYVCVEDGDFAWFEDQGKKKKIKAFKCAECFVTTGICDAKGVWQLDVEKLDDMSAHTFTVCKLIVKKFYICDAETEAKKNEWLAALQRNGMRLVEKAQLHNAENIRKEKEHLKEAILLEKEKKTRKKYLQEHHANALDKFEIDPQEAEEIAKAQAAIANLPKQQVMGADGVAKAKPVVITDKIDDLPADIKIYMDRMKVDKALLQANLPTLFNLLTFLDTAKPRRRFLTPEMSKISPEEMLKRKNKNPPHVLRPANELFEEITVKDARKLFTIKECLGEGGFGQVFESKVKEGAYGLPKQVALKIVAHKTDKEIAANIEEASFMAFCKHPNICTLYKCFKVANEIWYVMELLPGGNLKQATKCATTVGGFKEDEIAYIAEKILKAIQFMRQADLAHRDLKNLNVMMSTEGEVKLIDFGLAADFRKGPSVEMLGSPYWIAPEMIRNEPHSFPVDIFSFGICMVELCNNNPPGLGNERKAMFTNAVIGHGKDCALQEPGKWSEQFKDFLRLCLEPDQAKRATAESLLKHPFLGKMSSVAQMKKRFTDLFTTAQLTQNGFGM